MTDQPPETTGRKTDAELGILDIRQRQDGVTVVKVDRLLAAKNSEEYIRRADELIDRHITSADHFPPDMDNDGKPYTIKQLRDLIKDAVRGQIDYPDSSSIMIGPIRFLSMDYSQGLTELFNDSARTGEGFGQALANHMPDDGGFFWIEQHETGHTTGKNLGLYEPGADFYATVQFLKKYPDARDAAQTVGDMRVYKILNPDVPPNDLDVETRYGFGTYFAIGEALKLTPEEIRDMNEEEIVARASKYDAFAEARNPVEYDVKADILREMERLQNETGQPPSLKEALDSLIKRDIYATNGQIVGDESAIKYKTLNEFAGALDRLAKKGIASPLDGKYETLLRQISPQDPAPVASAPGLSPS